MDNNKKLFDIRDTALPLRQEERDTHDRDIYNRPSYRCNHYERERRRVAATGNKWAMENFNATHN